MLGTFPVTKYPFMFRRAGIPISDSIHRIDLEFMDIPLKICVFHGTGTCSKDAPIQAAVKLPGSELANLNVAEVAFISTALMAIYVCGAMVSSSIEKPGESPNTLSINDKTRATDELKFDFRLTIIIVVLYFTTSNRRAI